MFNFQPDMVIYHDPCLDGFTAAWAVRSRFGTENVEYYPTNYDKPPPDVTGKNVLIVDFSYKASVLREMAKTANLIVILDHHITAQNDLLGLISFDGSEAGLREIVLTHMRNAIAPRIVAHFDITKSGARMAWEFCRQDVKVPPLVSYVEDRDLWIFKYPLTKPFNVWLCSFPQTFEAWDRIHSQLEDNEPGFFLNEAAALARYQDLLVQRIADTAFLDVIDEREVPTCNAPMIFASEVGHELLQRNPAANFAAVFTVLNRSAQRKYSLRSDDSRMDVSEICRAYGGGGHRNAAGFEI